MSLGINHSPQSEMLPEFTTLTALMPEEVGYHNSTVALQLVND
jgi:hypothetical protein